MTTAQEEAIKQVKEILSEHFESAVITVQAEVDDAGDQHPTYWHGGFAAAFGLAYIAIENMTIHRREGEDDED